MKWLGVILLIGAVLVASENPDENEGIDDPDAFEGDIILTAEQRMAAEMGLDVDNPLGRGSARNKQWPGGVMFYVIDSSLYVHHGWEKLEAVKTSIFARGCWYTGIVAHEIGNKHNFRKYSKSTIDSLGTAYDYGSIMHYGGRAFTKNGKPTIVPVQSGATLGQRKGISDTDAKQMNLLYKEQCSGGGNGGGGSNCVDKHNSCPAWTKYCSSNNYVKANCKKTCKLC
ncbi:hypothetical protein OS493_008435 [Desmophyllum pertusum]|uniref:Metalloendopeptidase n=1 Tax=Desmophyllum pertusum TaxID=174260 RepID=A0A9X0DCL8_9CNID|nr:hypothetical protein OS493_008435 [Desmophyllum pertusum]